MQRQRNWEGGTIEANNTLESALFYPEFPVDKVPQAFSCIPLPLEQSSADLTPLPPCVLYRYPCQFNTANSSPLKKIATTMQTNMHRPMATNER